MSIDLENPGTVLGKVDAAATLVAQIRLATMVGDRKRVEHAINEAERHLYNALMQIEDEACPHHWITKRAGGSPSSAESDEKVRVCEICGNEEQPDEV